MKKLRERALRYDVFAYIYAVGAIALMTAPLISLWVLLYAAGCK